MDLPRLVNDKRSLHILVHNVAHTDLLLGIGNASASAAAETNSDIRAAALLTTFAKPMWDRYSFITTEVANYFTNPDIEGRLQLLRQPVPVSTTAAGVTAGGGLEDVAVNQVPVGFAMEEGLPVPRDALLLRDAARVPPGDTLTVNSVYFPLLSILIPSWLNEIDKKMRKRKSVGTEAPKLLLCLASGAAYPDEADAASGASSTEFVGQLLHQFIKVFYPHIIVNHICSGQDVVPYDANVMFFKSTLTQLIDQQRGMVATNHPDNWKKHFSLSLSLAAGAPARLTALNAALRPYQPSFVHVPNVKTFWYTGDIGSSLANVHMVDFDAVEGTPATDVGDLDEELRLLVGEMKKHMANALRVVRGTPDFRILHYAPPSRPLVARVTSEATGFPVRSRSVSVPKGDVNMNGGGRGTPTEGSTNGLGVGVGVTYPSPRQVMALSRVNSYNSVPDIDVVDTGRILHGASTAAYIPHSSRPIPLAAVPVSLSHITGVDEMNHHHPLNPTTNSSSSSSNSTFLNNNIPNGGSSMYSSGGGGGMPPPRLSRLPSSLSTSSCFSSNESASSPVSDSEPDHELASFWLRKTRQPVLAVLLVRKGLGAPQYFQGINLEVSMPTGSVCSERVAMSMALAVDPGLKRKDIRAVAVLSLPKLDHPDSKVQQAYETAGVAPASTFYSRPRLPSPRAPSSSSRLPPGAMSGGGAVGVDIDTLLMPPPPPTASHARRSVSAVKEVAGVKRALGKETPASADEGESSTDDSLAPAAKRFKQEWGGSGGDGFSSTDSTAHPHGGIVSATGSSSSNSSSGTGIAIGSAGVSVLEGASGSLAASLEWGGASGPPVIPHAVSDWGGQSDGHAHPPTHHHSHDASSSSCGVHLHAPATPSPTSPGLTSAGLSGSGRGGGAGALPSSRTQSGPPGPPTTAKKVVGVGIGGEVLPPGSAFRRVADDASSTPPSSSSVVGGSLAPPAGSFANQVSPNSREHGYASVKRPLTEGLLGSSAGVVEVPVALNPIAPCGSCMEWLRKVADVNPSFRIVTFTDISCERVYVKSVMP